MVYMKAPSDRQYQIASEAEQKERRGAKPLTAETTIRQPGKPATGA
jgi:hypothetical protein